LVTKLVSTVRESLSRFISEPVRRQVAYLHEENEYLREAYTKLQLDLENEGWVKLARDFDIHMDLDKLKELVDLCVKMAIKNPITCRSVSVQADYVFGQGVRFVAKDEDVQRVIDEFATYYHNRRVLTSHSSMLRREKELQASGNLFLALFTNAVTGRVQVRCLDLCEIADVIRDPEDSDREVYIKRSYSVDGRTEYVYYPAFGVHEKSGYASPWELEPKANHQRGRIEWDVPVYHIAFNRWGRDKFAIPEVYPQIDWAVSYKRVLEDWISILRSYARLAFKITGVKSKGSAAAMRSEIQTTVSSGNGLETNPSPTTGAWGILGKNVNMEPLKTAGATTPASEFTPVLNMAAAAHGLPNTFYGDASVGNYATAKTLDRPTELKMLSRQKLWKEVLTDVVGYVILQSARAKEGILKELGAAAQLLPDPFTGELAWFMEGDADTDITFEVHFPDILERNVTDRVRALVNAFTLFGKPLTDIIPDKKLVARLLMEALNIPDVEKRIPEFLAMWEENLKIKDGIAKKADVIPPASTLVAKAGKGAEDPSQGGDVGSNG